MIRSFFTQLATKTASLFALLFGRFHWASPPWFRPLVVLKKTKPKVFYTLFAALMLVFAALVYAYQWYSHLPQQRLIKAFITAPKITPLAEELVPDTLTINFGYGTAGNITSQAVAPLNMIGKDLRVLS